MNGLRGGPGRRLVRLAGILVVGLMGAACVRPASSQLVVPNLVGTHRDEAQAALKKEGLRYQVVVEPLRVRACQSFAGMVVAQSPRGGTAVLSWTVVTIVSYGSIPRGTVDGTACVPPP